MSHNNKTSILQWNARGLYKSKLNDFRYNLCSLNPTVLLLSETHWRNHFRVKFSSYRSFVCNRVDGEKGGVAILVKKNLRCEPFPLPSFHSIEAVGVTVHLNRHLIITFVSVYCPDGNCSQRSFTSDLVSLFDSVNGNVFIGGDWNAHHPTWETPSTSNTCGRAIADFLSSNDSFCLLTPKNIGTRFGSNPGHRSTIDLSFVSTELATTCSINLLQAWNSDHLPILISLDSHPSPPTSNTHRWNFKNPPWALRLGP